ncbi:Poly (ADP-ribose) glycohydrolase (PARG) [Popillia japonica]|uniref:poly(ADP-ribose) glycohydrolase n=1 Tax=Popillia japonica TaxID=7064 RepID=A0AAW1JIP9_POPJA
MPQARTSRYLRGPRQPAPRYFELFVRLSGLCRRLGQAGISAVPDNPLPVISRGDAGSVLMARGIHDNWKQPVGKMALVMLPCELPWWSSVQKILNKLSTTKNTLELIEGMQRIHDMCNVSLDPDEDLPDPEQFIGLLNFLDNDLTCEERCNFLSKTLPNVIKRALSLKQLKPKDGLHFSLQQQPDCVELEYSFVSSLLANAFFSTFPKRTEKSHPTLQNFNFCNFFKHLNRNSQKAKLRSILHYFDLLEEADNSNGSLRILRQVMSSKEWLTIEDWLECSLPLCPLQIKHEGRLERADPDSLQICFSSSKIGADVLGSGNSQECITLATFPEILCVLLNVEVLEDNEVLTIEKARHVSRIADPKNRATLEKFDVPAERTVCCVDAEDHSHLPLGQFEEDNVLRELNKCLLAFQQKHTKTNNEDTSNSSHPVHFNATFPGFRNRRLSPIGESLSSSHSETGQNGNRIPIITLSEIAGYHRSDSCSTNKSGSDSPPLDNNNVPNTLKVQIQLEKGLLNKSAQCEGMLNNRRGRFIVLGSSGECLPVKRKPESRSSLYSSAESSEEEFLSAKTSLDDGSEDEDFNKRYSMDLDTPEKRNTFAQRLRDALRRETSSMSQSTESSSYAVGITVGGSGVRDQDIKVRRGGSTGFILHEESLDEHFLNDSLQQEKQWIDKFKSKLSNLSRKESNKSSDYSFSTEYSSELEEVYEQFSKWLEHPVIEVEKETKKELDGRDLAVVQFAGSLLKRTLSETFAGVPLTEGGCENTLGVISSGANKKNKLILNAKSMSLELARQKHRLAAQLLSQIAQKPSNGVKMVTTGNWGCGSSKKGDVQLKVIIQWLAASVAGVPVLIYYTAGHIDLAPLDTIYRVLRDRKWNVKDLAQATLRYSSQIIHGRNENTTLFEELIGIERN